MAGLERVSVTIESDLLARFDELIEEAGHTNRSEAVRDLIRARLVEDDLAGDAKVVVGTVTLLFDHHKRELGDRLRDVGHDHHNVIVSSMHVHLDHHNCLEVIVLKGKAKEVRHVSAHLVGMKGVKHGKVVLTSANL
jgi:CopG family nickel-responsive transcriptional regulator